MRRPPSTSAILRELKNFAPKDREQKFNEFCIKAKEEYSDINWSASRLVLPNGDVEWRGQSSEFFTFDTDGNVWYGLKSQGIKWSDEGWIATVRNQKDED